MSSKLKEYLPSSPLVTSWPYVVQTIQLLFISEIQKLYTKASHGVFAVGLYFVISAKNLNSSIPVWACCVLHLLTLLLLIHTGEAL